MQQRVRHVLVSPRFTLGTVAAIGLIGLFVAYLIPNAYTTVLPPFLLVGAAVGAVGLRSDGEVPPRVERLAVALPGRRLLLLWALLCWPATVAAYVGGGFETTLAVHGLLVVAYAVAAVGALVLASTPIRLGLVLGTALLHRGMVYFAGAVPLGNDALFHLRAAEAIAATGGLEPLATSKYWYAPLYHLAVAGLSLVPGVDVRAAAFLAVTTVATVVPAVAIWYFLRRYWTDAVGVLGALLFVVADHAILATVHATPTSLGVAWFAALLLATDRTLTDAGRRWPALFGVALVGLLFTHQLSLFVATVALVSYIAVRELWQGRLTLRGAAMAVSLVGAFLLQATVTEYAGPAGDTGSFLATVAPAIVSGLLSGLQAPARTGGFPPGVAVSGADALTPVQLLGTGVLFGLAVLGVVGWVRRRRVEALGPVVGLGAIVAVTCTIVFGPPAVGANVFIPGRWFPFIYVALAALGAPAIAALVASVRARVGAPTVGPRSGTRERGAVVGGERTDGGTSSSSGEASTASGRAAASPGMTAASTREESVQRVAGQTAGLLVPVLVVLALVVPYAAVMTTNGYGAPDGPVLDDAPGASRISTTAGEAAGYQYAIAHHGESTLVASFGTWRVIDRWYGADVVLYRTAYGEPGTSIAGEQLVVSRAYDATGHASYELEYEGRTYRVYGALTGAGPTEDVVYDNGDVTLYRTDG